MEKIIINQDNKKEMNNWKNITGQRNKKTYSCEAIVFFALRTTTGSNINPNPDELYL